MRLYKYIQKDIQQENIQYQDLVEYNTGSVGNPVYPSKKSIIRNYLDAMDYYTPTDTDYACRYRILTKIINKYYNYELFTDNYEYFGNRMLWRLNKVMPTYRAKFNSMLAQNGYESIWQNGLLWEHREGTRDTKRPEKDENNHPVNFDKTELGDTTTTVGYNSDYPQVIVDSDHDYNATGDKTVTGRTGDDTVTHAMQENVGYGEDITRKFSPEEIAKAKLLFAQLIFNIDEEIVNAVADLFVLVDYPFEDDFDVAIQMSILDDAKAYTNLKFNEGKAYTDQEVAKAKEIVYIYDSDATYDAIATVVYADKLPIIMDTYGKYWYFEQASSGDFTFVNGIDWMKIDYDGQWTTGVYSRPELFKCTYNQTTFAQITQALNDGKIPYVIYPTGEHFYFYLAIGNTKYRFTESYIRETGITYFIDIDNTNQWGIVPVDLEVKSNKVTSISSLSTDAQYPSAKAVYGVEQSIYHAIGNSYQTLGNLVTSWGSPTSDSKYPSEKLVKDSLNNLDNVYVIDNGDTTKYTELVQAHSAGKVLICRGTASTYDEGKFYILYEWDDVNDYARFAMVDEAPWILIAETTLTNPLVWDNRYVALQEKLEDSGATPNFKTVNSTSLLGSGNIDTTEIYWVTPNTTTFRDILAMKATGKIMAIKDEYGYYYLGLCEDSSPGSLIFSRTDIDASGVLQTTSWYVDALDNWTKTSKIPPLNLSEQVTLLSASWAVDGTQTVSTTNNPNLRNVFVSPNGDPTAYASAGIYCSAQGSNSLTFTCTSTPSTDIVVNVVIM